MEHRDDQWPMPLWMYLTAAFILGTIPWHIGWAIGWIYHQIAPLVAALF